MMWRPPSRVLRQEASCCPAQAVAGPETFQLTIDMRDPVYTIPARLLRREQNR